MNTVSLIIDYGNGVEKRFSSIPWKKDMTILAAIEEAAKIPPGANLTFGSDRSGHARALVLDEMPAGETSELDWLIFLNEKPFEHFLGTETSFNFIPDERTVNLLKPGDRILLKLSAKAQAASTP